MGEPIAVTAMAGHAPATVAALNRIDHGVLLLYADITVGAKTYLVKAETVEFYVIDKASNKIKVGVRTRFNGVVYDKLTDMFKAAVEWAWKHLGKDINAKNFDCWGRVKALVPANGRWLTCKLRDLIEGDVRKGLAPFDFAAIDFDSREGIGARAHSMLMAMDQPVAETEPIAPNSGGKRHRGVKSSGRPEKRERTRPAAAVGGDGAGEALMGKIRQYKSAIYIALSGNPEAPMELDDAAVVPELSERQDLGTLLRLTPYESLELERYGRELMLQRGRAPAV